MSATNTIHTPTTLPTGKTLNERADLFRLDAGRRLPDAQRDQMGQFLTPAGVAQFMASLFTVKRDSIRLLDAGAGVGSLTAAFVAKVCKAERPPALICVVAYEIDPMLIEYLADTLAACETVCRESGISFQSEIRDEDFIEAGASLLSETIFSRNGEEKYDCVILNPPYRKIRSDSRERRLLRSIGIETSNLYTGFLAIVIRLLREHGELVAITPRSFCNGPYFKRFRKSFLDTMTLRRVHVFEQRNQAFRDDRVLQENIIFQAIKGAKQSSVTLSSSQSVDDDHIAIRRVAYTDLACPDDPNYFIRLETDEIGKRVADQVENFTATIGDLGIGVSTGRVVDFRARDFLRSLADENSMPLIYPTHFEHGFIVWPKPQGKKPNAIAVHQKTRDLFVPTGTYVLVKRFSAKEERRRVVAAVYDPSRMPNAPLVGFENHLNYYHQDGSGLPVNLARGLAAFLNSTMVDYYFRQFSGHTQVNANDLRSLRYPTREQLETLGKRIQNTYPEQHELDQLVQEVLIPMTKNDVNPINAKRKIEEALTVLKDLGLPREQRNERSALTLLALLGLRPDVSWSQASAPLMGITQMMNFFSEHYGKQYAPNTRETVRRFTVHQFVQGGLAILNPDKPSRPTNSPKTVYQVEPGLLEVLQMLGSEDWKTRLKEHLVNIETLTKQYARERKMRLIPVQLTPSTTISLSPGGQNVLVKKTIEEFCSRFTPGAKAVYVGDTQKKWAYFDEELLADLGVTIEEHGKMPDVVVYHEAKEWLVLIEAVTSHGPVNPKRQLELKELFKDSKVGLVFVTTFLDRRTLIRYLDQISWETEVWVAEAPTHLIHFNGERFLGPYPEDSSM